MVDPKELERLARKAFKMAWAEGAEVHIDNGGLGMAEARLVVREHEDNCVVGHSVLARVEVHTGSPRDAQALHAALLVLAGEDRGPAAIVTPADTPIPPGQTGVVIRCEPDYERGLREGREGSELASAASHMAGYAQAIRDVVALLKDDEKSWRDWDDDRGREAWAVRHVRRSIERGEAKGAAEEEA